MIKLILLLVSIVILSAGFYWLAEHSGSLVFTIYGYEIETTVVYAVAALLCFTIVLQFVFSLIYRISNIPRFFAEKKKDNLIRLLSELVIATKIEDQEGAYKTSKQLIKFPLPEKLKSIFLLIESEREESESIILTQLTSLVKYKDIAQSVYKKLIERNLENGKWQVANSYCLELWQIQKSNWLLIAIIKSYINGDKWQEILEFLENISWINLLDSKLIKVFIAVAKFKIAYINYCKELYVEAEELLEKARSYLVDFTPVTYLLIEVLIKREKYYEAFDLIQEQWQKTPHPAFTKLAMQLAAFFNNEEYVTLVMKTIDENQQHYESRLLLAEATINSSQFDIASRELAEALEHKGNFRACLLMLKFCLRARSNIKEALDWLKRTVKAEDNKCVESYYWDFEKRAWSNAHIRNGIFITSL